MHHIAESLGDDGVVGDSNYKAVKESEKKADKNRYLSYLTNHIIYTTFILLL
jgi:hypothetical protein